MAIGDISRRPPERSPVGSAENRQGSQLGQSFEKSRLNGGRRKGRKERRLSTLSGQMNPFSQAIASEDNSEVDRFF